MEYPTVEQLKEREIILSAELNESYRKIEMIQEQIRNLDNELGITKALIKLKDGK